MITLRRPVSRYFLIIALVPILMTFFMLWPAKVAHALPASYHAPCWGNTCNGGNPYTYTGSTGYPCAGVSGANWYVVASGSLIIQDGTNTQVGYVQVWYSGSCNVNWGRVVANNYDGITDHFLWAANLYSKTSGHSYQSCSRTTNECVNWYSTNGVDLISNMYEIDDPACFSVTVAYGQGPLATGKACQ